MAARVALATLLLVLFAAAVVMAGHRDSAPAALPGVERLGPDAGESVPHYLARAEQSLPAPGAGPVWALVQFGDHRSAADAARATGGVRVARVVLRVPLPRVQTALVTRAVPGQRPESEIAGAMRSAAAERQAGAQQAPAGARTAAVAAVEAERLGAGCACVVALLVHGDRAALDELAGRDGVRAVHAAEVGAPLNGLAISPLLPEQRDVVGPVPDDGPVP